MMVGHPIRDIAYAIVQACTKDLPDVEYEYRKPGKTINDKYTTETRTRRPHEGELEVYMYPQLFSDTTLGRGGIGGQTMTTAYTVVIIDSNTAAVYRAGDLDYLVKTDTKFWELLMHFQLPERRGSSKFGLTRVSRTKKE